MKRSEQIGKLAEALSKTQIALQPAPFDRENPYFKSRYATLTSIFEAAKVAFSNGLSVSQGIETVEGKVRVTTLLMHVSGEWIETVIEMKPKNDGPQEVGSAGTYGRRYGLAAILGLCSVEDDDGNDASPLNDKKGNPKPSTKPKTNQKSTEPAQGSTQNPPEGKSTPPAEKTPATGTPQDAPLNPGKIVADQLTKIRELANRCNVKNLEEGLKMVSAFVGRQVKALTDLSAPEREKVITDFQKSIEISEGK